MADAASPATPASNAGTVSPAPAASAADPAPATGAPAASATAASAPADNGTAPTSGAPEQKDASAPATNSLLSGETGQDAQPAQPQPVEYKDFKLPEGMDAESPMLKSFQEVAGKFGISQAYAEEIVASVGQHVKEAAEAPYKAWTELNDKWQNEVKADPEIGGDKLQNVLATVSRVMDDPKLTDPGFRQALALTGAGNNPAIIKTLHRWAAMLSEGGPVRAGSPAPQPRKSAAAKFYPELPN